ncbi:MAG: repair protein SbcC/Rad50 [Petrotoga sp.]|nr:repair protein SbcC/Rad50 [Petrotoga sp.]
MKPIKLKFQAFGPFLEEQEINFNKLRNDTLFLITGPTGAGKTTIFDAICYALYGNGSMGERGDAIARSHFADENTDTYVEFEFQFKDKIIEISRTPSYERSRKDGEGTTKQNSQASIKIYQNGQLILHETGVKKVNSKVEEYLGLNYEQFKQIVMIPQGEFRKFITANSNERAEIFKKIFDISIYECFEQKIDEIFKNIEKGLKAQQQRIKNILETINLESEEYNQLLKEENIDPENLIDQLTKEIRKREIYKEETEKQKSQKQDKLQKLNMDLENIKKVNELIEKKETFKKEIIELQQNSEYIQEREGLLNRLKKAKEILPYEERYVEYLKELNDKKNQLKNQQGILDKSMEEKQRIDEKLLEIEKQYQKISAVEKEIDDLSQKLDKYVKYKNLIKEFKTKKKLYDEKVRESQEKDEKLSKAQKKLEQNEKYISENEDINVEILKNEIITNEKLLSAAKELSKNYSELVSLHKDYQKVKKQKEEIEIEIQNLRKEQNKKTTAFIKSQAYHLATTLKEGEPCPVCGSTVHPSPAKSSGKLITEKELEEINKNLEKKEKEKTKILKNYEDVSNKYLQEVSLFKSEYKRICEELQIPQESEHIYAHIQNLIKMLKDRLNQQKQEYEEKIKIYNKVKSLKNDNKKVKEEIKDLEEQRENLRKNIEESKSEIIELSTKITNLKEQLENKTENGIISEIQEKRKFIYNIKTTYEQKREEANRISEIINSSKGTIKTLTEDITKLDDQVKNAEQKFDQMVGKMGFENQQEYQRLKEQINLVESLEDEVQKYKEELKNKQTLLIDLEESTKNLKKTDEAPLANETKQLQNEIEELIKNETNLEYEIKHLKKTKINLETVIKEIEKQEKEYSTIKNLRDVSKGDNNTRISLSKYVLAYYFEEILSQANLRLNKLTDGRYQLHRSSKVLDARKSEGLEIMVFDIYTGKEREIKTLSGGESFKAALALALGLADVVQSEAGGISLDTIFIDEGFGSLDTNSLDSAIEVLTELNSSGRMVGIISHVSELKERINSKIEVIPGKNGSYIQTRFSFF